MALKRRGGRALLASVVLASVLAVPMSAGGQDETTYTAGPWEGSIFFDGSFERTNPDFTTLWLVLFNSITINMIVDETGEGHRRLHAGGDHFLPGWSGYRQSHHVRPRTDRHPDSGGNRRTIGGQRHVANSAGNVGHRGQFGL